MLLLFTLIELYDPFHLWQAHDALSSPVDNVKNTITPTTSEGEDCTQIGRVSLVVFRNVIDMLDSFFKNLHTQRKYYLMRILGFVTLVSVKMNQSKFGKM